MLYLDPKGQCSQETFNRLPIVVRENCRFRQFNIQVIDFPKRVRSRAAKRLIRCNVHYALSVATNSLQPNLERGWFCCDNILYL